MRAEIVSVGSEILLGQIVDTNAAFIARQLAALGLDLFQKTTVGDNLGRVAAALETALGRAEVVITTGGLGPTEDDVTREAVARATGRELEFHPELLEEIEGFFRARGLPLSPSNRKQAFIPRGAIPLPNPVGTAPCFIVEEGDRTLIVLPGVPREMEYLLRTGALPHVRARYGLQASIVSRLVRVAGLGESRVGELLADLMAKGSNPTVGTMAHPGQVDVRIAAKGPDVGLDSQVLGFDFDGVAISALAGFDATPFATMYGARVGSGDVEGSGRWAIEMGAGRDPAADATVEVRRYESQSLTPLPGFLGFAGDTYGVNVAAGGLGYF